MKARAVLFALLGVVAAAAAVLSFAALRDLALICGFDSRLAWLLPVVVDAGAAAGSLVWLGGQATGPAERFARALALALLGSSVAANALGHGLTAYTLAPPWWVVVIVSAVAPAVLGAVVHLAVLVGRSTALPDRPAEDSEVAPDVLDEHGLSRAWEHAPPVEPSWAERAAELIESGAGRRRLSRELDITEYEARQLLAQARAMAPTADDAPSGTDDEHALHVLPGWPQALNGSGDRS